jgi:hypothetical protein
MIGRRAPLFEYLNLSIAALRNSGQHVQKIFSQNVPRTAATHQNSARLQ